MEFHGIRPDYRVFSGNSNKQLAEAMCKSSDAPRARPSKVLRRGDPVEIGENVRGLDTYVVQSTSPDANTNLMELLIMIDALKRVGGLHHGGAVGAATRGRTGRARRACPSPRSSSPTSSRPPARPASSRWTCTPARSRASSTCPSITSTPRRCSSSTCASASTATRRTWSSSRRTPAAWSARYAKRLGSTSASSTSGARSRTSPRS